MAYTRALGSLGACCSACAKGGSALGDAKYANIGALFHGGETEAEIAHKFLANTNSGFLNQLDYVRDKGVYVVRVETIAPGPDGKTMIRFQRPAMSPHVIGLAAAAVALGYYLGRRK